MGFYTGIRFSGIIKERYRKAFWTVAVRGEWKEFCKKKGLLAAEQIDKIEKFTSLRWNERIPLGDVRFMPLSWYDYNDYDKQSGKWKFSCSFKNYDDILDEFFQIASFVCESVTVEVYYQYSECSSLYELRNSGVVLVEKKYSFYKAPKRSSV